MQKYFDSKKGVVHTEVGYANGPDSSKAPTYEDVCNDSGHAECLLIDFDENVITLEEILKLYFRVIDPLSVNRQGEDRGIQYRTGVYYTDESQIDTINRVFDEITDKLGREPVTERGPIREFFPAEEYHQKYLDKNPGGYCHIPKELF